MGDRDAVAALRTAQRSRRPALLRALVETVDRDVPPDEARASAQTAWDLLAEAEAADRAAAEAVPLPPRWGAVRPAHSEGCEPIPRQVPRRGCGGTPCGYTRRPPRPLSRQVSRSASVSRSSARASCSRPWAGRCCRPPRPRPPSPSWRPSGTPTVPQCAVTPRRCACLTTSAATPPAGARYDGCARRTPRCRAPRRWRTSPPGGTTCAGLPAGPHPAARSQPRGPLQRQRPRIPGSEGTGQGRVAGQSAATIAV